MGSPNIIVYPDPYVGEVSAIKADTAAMRTAGLRMRTKHYANLTGNNDFAWTTFGSPAILFFSARCSCSSAGIPAFYTNDGTTLLYQLGGVTSIYLLDVQVPIVGTFFRVDFNSMPSDILFKWFEAF